MTNLRKTLKHQVAKTAEEFAIAIAECVDHGTGSRECECDMIAYQYDYLITALRETDSVMPTVGSKSMKRRRKYRPIHAAPHFIKPQLAEIADEMYHKAQQLKHTPEVIWDDSCCAAMYCEKCDTWGHTMYDYLDDSTGREVEGVLFEKECGA
jgi:hypothetical protein